MLLSCRILQKVCLWCLGMTLISVQKSLWGFHSAQKAITLNKFSCHPAFFQVQWFMRLVSDENRWGKLTLTNFGDFNCFNTSYTHFIIANPELGWSTGHDFYAPFPYMDRYRYRSVETDLAMPLSLYGNGVLNLFVDNRQSSIPSRSSTINPNPWLKVFSFWDMKHFVIRHSFDHAWCIMSA